MDDLELIDEIVRRADEHQRQKERKFAVDEIKKLKEEIHDVLLTCFLDEEDIYAILNAIDKHIEELKGENNGE